MQSSDSLGDQQSTTTTSEESVDVPENFAPESQKQTADETGNTGNIEKGNYDESEYEEYLKQLEAMQSNPLLAFNNAITTFAVSLTKPPRSNSSYPGGYYINGYFEGMKIPLPSNLGNVGIITELLIMQTRDSVQSLYAGLWSVNEDVKSAGNRISSLDVKIANGLASANNRIDAVDKKAVSAKTNADAALSGMTSANDRISSLDVKIANGLASANNRIDAVDGKAVSALDKIKDLYALNTSANNRINAVDAKAVSALDKIKDLYDLNTSANNRINAVDAKAVSALDKIAIVVNDISKANKRIDSLSTDVSNSNKRIDSVDVKATSALDQLKTAIGDISNVSSRVDSLATAVTNSNKRIDAVDVKAVSALDKIDALGTWKNIQLAWNTKQELDNSNQQKAIDSQLLEINKLKERNRYKRIQSGSLNDLIETGIYSISRKDVSDNAPDVGNYLLEVVRYYDTGRYGLVMQKATKESNGTTYTRMSVYPGDSWTEWKKDIDSSDLIALKNQVINDSKAYTNQEVAKVKSVNDSQTGILNTLVSDMKNRVDEINALGTWKNVQLAWNTNQELDNSNQQKAIDANAGSIAGIKTMNDNQQKAIDANAGSIAGIKTVNDNQQKTIDSHSTSIAGINKVDETQTSAINTIITDMKKRVDEINALGTWKNVQLAWNLKQETDNSNQQKAIDANAGSIAGIKTVNDNQQKSIDANAGSIANIKTIANNHETRITKLESTDWSDLFDTASIVHAVDVVRDKVVLNTSQLKTFGDLNLQYLNDFKILLDKLYKGFSDYPDGFFWQNLRKHLSIASVLFDDKFQEGIDQLDGTLVLILKGINSIGDGINTVSGWLKLIYNKPSEIFQNNESGTNFWDVLKQAIATLGDLLNGTLGNAVKALDSILEFLDSLLDKMIDLIIPKNTDFMKDKLKGASLKFNVKFGSVLGLADNIKKAFTPAKADFMSAISFDFMGARFAPDRKIFDMYVPKVRAVMSLMIWLEVAWYIYKRLTGSGDLINDN